MADGDFNLATIWASVVPETSKVGPAMDEAGEEAKRRWTDKVKDFGKPISESLSKASEHAKDTFSGVGHSITDILAKAGRDGGESLTASFSKAGSDSARGLVSSFAGAEGPIGAVADKIGGLIGGKLGDAIHSLDGPLKSVGIDIGAWQGPIQDVVSKTGDFKGQIANVTDLLKNMPGVIGRVGTALEAISGPLGWAAAAVQGLDTFSKSDFVKNNPTMQTLFGSPPPGATDKDWHLGPIPIKDPYGWEKHIPGITPPKGAPPPGSPFTVPGSPAPGPPTVGAPHHDFYHDTYGGAATPHGAAPSGNTVPLMQNPDGTWTSSNPAWAHLIGRESGGRNVRQGITDVNSGGNEAEGLFQITPATWRSHGGLAFAPNPLAATPQQQAAIAARILQGNPSGSDWGAGMSGRESASGLLGGLGAGGASSAGQNFYKDWYPASDAGGGGAWTPSGSLSSRGGGGTGGGGTGLGAPTGAQHDPLYVMHADDTGAGAGGAGSPMQSQGEQLGKGLIGGLLQGLGLDGSVFHTFNGKGSPLDFGSVKMGMGLLNWGMGLLGGGRGGGGGDGASLGGAGGGGGLGGMLPGLGSLLPHPNAAALHGDAPGGVAGGDTHHYGDVINGQLNFTNNGNGQNVVPPELHEQVNAGAAGRAGAQGIIPNSGNLPSGMP